MYHPFSVAETIKTAWNVLKRNFVPLIVYSVISLFIYEFVDFLKAFILIDDDMVSRLIIILLQMIVQAYIGLSFYKLILTLMDRAYYEFEFKDIIPSFKMAFNFIVIGLLLGILFAVLFFLYVLAERNLGYPSIFETLELIFVMYLGLRCIFCICFIVDDNSAPLESLKQSFEITKDNFFKTLSIFLIIIAILILALIPVIAIMNFFGLDENNGGFVFRLAFYCWFILTFPFIQVIIMVTYRKLVYSHLDVDDDIAETN